MPQVTSPAPSVRTLPTRVWLTSLWACTLAALVCAGQWFYFDSNSRLDRAALLTPAHDLSAEQRESALRSILGYAEIAGGRWISPADMTREAAESAGGAGLDSVFPADAAWMPWVLEIQFREIALKPEPAAFRVAALRKDPYWRLVAWDDSAVRADALRLRGALTLLGILAGALGLLGAVALAVTPRIGGGALFEAALALTLTCATLAGLGFAPRVAGVEFTPRDWAALLAPGIILAALVGPVIKGRIARPAPEPASQPAPAQTQTTPADSGDSTDPRAFEETQT